MLEVIEKLIKRLTDPVIVTVGDVMIDHWLFGLHLRRTEEYGRGMDICDIEEETITCGGAANAAQHIASLGGHSMLVGVVGDNMWGAEVEVACRSSSITPYIVRDPKRKTTVKSRVVGRDRECYTRFDIECREPISGWVADEVCEYINDLKRHADLFLISDYAKGIVTEQVVQCVKETGKPFVVDPKRGKLSKYKGATLIKPNARELTLKELITLLQLAPLMVTKGKEGIVLETRESEVHLCAWDIPSKDAIGAGDGVIAAVSLGLASRLNLVDALNIGNLAGAVCTMHEGTHHGVTKSQMLEVASQFSLRGS